MEHAKLKDMKCWRKEFKEYFKNHNLLMYDPVEQEADKVDCTITQHIKNINNLKKEGKYKEFYESMWKIWFSRIPENHSIVDVLKNIRMEKLTYGNEPEKKALWGDFEAVVRSDFLVVYLPESVKTIGTIYEIVASFMFNIPIYLIVPDNTKDKINSSLLFGVQMSNGRFFNDTESCMKYVKRKYF